jgi:integrase/recombinase XerD
MIYLHVRRTHLGSTPSPIDWLPVRQLPGWAIPDNNNNNPDYNNRESPTS